ncbi:hypothetical protein EJ110_NYTH11507 [Nymphaea thermarum]|nr:hypothetical protein EJ110_NYTH11507 [Nymphaea thermarum]
MGTQSAKFSLSMDSPSLLLLQWIVCFLFVVGNGGQAQAQNVTDPVEVSAFRSISKHWNLSSTASWNLSEPCSGTAIDSSTIDDARYNPAIKCSCTNGTCHITKLKVYALNIRGTIPEALANLTLMDNMYETLHFFSFNIISTTIIMVIMFSFDIFQNSVSKLSDWTIACIPWQVNLHGIPVSDL